jgi:D-alanyl-lipoteichoic acid acyltransferase DltB (MBOAT superfamily)
MLFNSIEFAIFLPVVFLLYWFLDKKSYKAQNLLLLAASYLFYGWWDWRFLSLIIFSSFIDYSIGLGLNKAKSKIKRRFLLWISILVNLGFLGFFKYFNFFTESFVDAFTLLGKPMEVSRLNIILPVGISFYTFQTLSYSIDVYRKKLEPTKDIVAFFAFVSFFPQLVAGPIERATNLLPQFYTKRKFDYSRAVDGLRQILWGLFKKVVIADNCAAMVNDVYGRADTLDGSTLLVASIFFAFQIYGDFSGYSDIAIGTSRLFGFNLMQNFSFPYFSRDIGEFWRRWHISLSSWFRDYLYIPLGGSKGSKLKVVRNIFIIFLVSGFWHGANWTFIAWGFLNALYFIPLLLMNRNRQNVDSIASGKMWPSKSEFLKVVFTFSLTTLAWIFFRSDSISQAFLIISKIFSSSLFTMPYIQKGVMIFVIIIFLMIEWVGRENQYAIEKTGLKWSKWLRWPFYYAILLSLFVLVGEPQEFIYFQF